MKIGDLYYKGEKIENIAKQALECCSLECVNCNDCKAYYLCNTDIESLSEIEIELPPIIKAVDISTDNVNHPTHYTGKYECIDVMAEVFGADAVKNFCICNAFKYLYRYKRKNGVEDVKKAKWYLDKYLEMECAKNEN